MTGDMFGGVGLTFSQNCMAMEVNNELRLNVDEQQDDKTIKV